jgi:hypothetical protein
MAAVYTFTLTHAIAHPNHSNLWSREAISRAAPEPAVSFFISRASKPRSGSFDKTQLIE